MKNTLLVSSLLILIPKISSAHCPLCTAGAGALAILAAYLGVSTVVVGILIGAFALALSLWISKSVKKEYVPYQKQILVILIFLGTVIPIMPLVRDYGPLYVSFIGEYGTTYTINLYVFGVILGSIIMLFSPLVSKLITKLRGRHIPFQGVTITIILLVLVSVIVQLIAW